MKKLGFNKKNWIALTLAAVLAVGGFGVQKSLAAERINENKQCEVTITIPTEYYGSGSEKVSNPIAGYAGEIKVKFYKVADMNLDGQLTVVSESGLTADDLKSLQAEKVSAETQDALAKKAYGNIGKMSCQDVEFDLSKADSITKPLDRALYLCVPQDAEDDYNKYSFKYFLVAVPGSKVITATTVDENGNVVSASGDDIDDTWVYNVEILLKAEATPKYGNLIIEKELTTFNESLGTASFIFDVEATKDGKNVFSNVYTLQFNSNGSNGILVEKIPAGATVTVTEIYTGASYSLECDGFATVDRKAYVDGKEYDVKSGNVVIADEYINCGFLDNYDDRLIEGGISVVNTFDKIETTTDDGQTTVNYSYAGNNL